MSSILEDNVDVDFKEAMDRIRYCPTREQVADWLGVSFHTVQQAMLPEGSVNRRTPPPKWREGLAKLARERSAELAKLADQLERGG